MISRRDFATAGAAASLLAGSGSLGRLAAQQKLTQGALLAFAPVGQVTLLHFTDIHAQLSPLYFREPSVNLGVGAVRGLPPHITGAALLKKYGLKPGSAEAYALSNVDFARLAASYGRLGGLDRMATRRQRRPRRAAGPDIAARRRRYLAGRLYRAQVPGAAAWSRP